GRPGPREALLVGARQTGKNQADGAWTVRGLSKYGSGEGGQAVKSAPTYKPQISISKRRLKRFLSEIPLMADEWTSEEGYIFRFRAAAIAFLSAHESANRVGETADLWLTVDESQDTSQEVFDKDFSPMRGFRGVPTFFQGTEWTEDCLLAVTRRRLEVLQEQDGIQRVWRVPWELRARDNPRYDEFVRNERGRLGPQHPIFLSQYCLVPLAGVGRFLEPGWLDLIFGDAHPRATQPVPGRIYVGGVDYCGADEQPDEAAFDLERAELRDSTVALVGELVWRKERSSEEHRGSWRLVPVVRVVASLILPGQHPEAVTEKVDEFLFQRFRCLKVVADARGVGDGPSMMLHRRRPAQVTRLQSTAQDVSRMGYRLLGAIGTGRFGWWQHDHSPDWAEAQLQFRHLEKRVLPGPGKLMRWGHPEKQVDVDGKPRNIHDDIPKAAGYLVEAAYEHLATIQPPAMDLDEYVPWDESAGMG
ncbi:MAG: hypothetical protein AB1758_34845, partial [Candidatus Eremiobacterota bacterium]